MYTRRKKRIVRLRERERERERERDKQKITDGTMTCTVIDRESEWQIHKYVQSERERVKTKDIELFLNGYTLGVVVE